MAGIDPQEPTLEQSEAHVVAIEWEEEYSREELAVFLEAEIDVPPGDIDRNAQEALQSFDIDLEAIIQERDTELDFDRELEHDIDFDR